MILGFVQVCYNSIHQPFASQGAEKVQNLNSERPALKIIRAVLRDSDIDPEEAANYSIHRCYCNFKIKIEEEEQDEAFNPELTLDELEIKDGDSVFIRKVDERGEEKVDEMEEDQGEWLVSTSQSQKQVGRPDLERKVYSRWMAEEGSTSRSMLQREGIRVTDWKVNLLKSSPSFSSLHS